jgi:hypothetical protein
MDRVRRKHIGVHLVYWDATNKAYSELLIRDVRISFDIGRTDHWSVDMMEVQIYNLNETVRSKIQSMYDDPEYYSYAMLTMVDEFDEDFEFDDTINGYGSDDWYVDNCQVIFLGTLTNLVNKIERNVDIITRIEAQDGFDLIKSKTSDSLALPFIDKAREVEQNLKAQGKIDDKISIFGQDVSILKFLKDGGVKMARSFINSLKTKNESTLYSFWKWLISENGELKKKFDSLIPETKKTLSEELKKHDLNDIKFTIQNNDVKIIKLGGSINYENDLNDDIPIFNFHNGLIKAPINTGNKVMATFNILPELLLPMLAIGVEDIDLTDSQYSQYDASTDLTYTIYVISTCSLRGDNFGDNWNCQCEMSIYDTDKKSIVTKRNV